MTDTSSKTRPRGRPGLTPEARDAALEAANRLLGEKGLDGMQARAVAREAGLSVGSIYKLFGDIEDLIRELNLRTYQDLARFHQARLDEAGLPADRVFDRLMLLARAYVDFIRTNEARWSALLSFNRRQSSAPPKAYLRTEAELYGIIEDVMTPAPGFSDPAHRARAARALWASVHGIVTITLPNASLEDSAGEALRQAELVVGAVMRDAAAGGQL